jgi:hypothetical protein
VWIILAFENGHHQLGSGIWYSQKSHFFAISLYHLIFFCGLGFKPKVVGSFAFCCNFVQDFSTWKINRKGILIFDSFFHVGITAKYKSSIRFWNKTKKDKHLLNHRIKVYNIKDLMFKSPLREKHCCYSKLLLKCILTCKVKIHTPIEKNQCF